MIRLAGRLRPIAEIDLDEIAFRGRRSLERSDFERGLRVGGDESESQERGFHCESVKFTSTTVSTGAGVPLSKVG